MTVTEQVTSQAKGVAAQSIGGSGGDGGSTGFGAPSRVQGGIGGIGGSAGAASATILGAVTLIGAGVTGMVDGQAIAVQSNGGSGGAGGSTQAAGGSFAGDGGDSGPGGSASLVLGNATQAATVRASGNYAHGALVQSVGGGGGEGGQATFIFGGGGGNGSAGGSAGPVSIQAPNASVIVTSSNGIALVAQSVGGGGGAGGDAVGVPVGVSFSVGGGGGLGGNGSDVTVNLGPGVFASTNALGGGGILAQSIGGGGGNAGSATASGSALLTVTIGGDAGSGGRGGTVKVTNGGLVTTNGDHAVGVQAQSIGGGGGKGGSAFSFNLGILPSASVAIGGAGAKGGIGGAVNVNNNAQVTTYGADAHGVLAQSIGGGGGNGGGSAARNIALSGSKYLPAVSIAVSTGGRGGEGNTGGPVTLVNTGLITTAGQAAYGVIAQSIGGGGGSGGDATAAAFSSGGSLDISIATAVGGQGGTGARGGAVAVDNQNLIFTLGQDAYGVFAQSIGGGGGTGGNGDATATAGDAKASFAASVAVGGGGGSGADAGTVSLTNSGSITTRGDGSDAVFAQSIGGGGGAAGGGTATASGGKVAIAVGVGGSGGVGGDANTVALVNTGSILTRGTDAVGLFAQSIGGGGGKAGKGGATAGGVDDLSNLGAFTNILSNGLNLNETVTMIADGVVQIGEIGQNIIASVDELRNLLKQPQAGNGEEGKSSSIDVQVNVGAGIGGRGGGAGAGGTVNVTNTGGIAIFGAQSDAILAQSIGGGGGSGGAASSTGASGDDTPIQAGVAVGGVGGAGGAGGAVTVVNGPNGTILTQGVLAMGIVAQSIGGGGGEGSIAGTVNGSLKSLAVGLGGDGGGGGNGGTVTVSSGNGDGSSSITTTGKHGLGILAQSIGGGGGLVRSMTTDQTFDPSKIDDNPQGRIADVQGISIDLGGRSGIGGSGGLVNVNLSGALRTGGLGAHGVVAQSIGGGGGFVAGGQVVRSSMGAEATAGNGNGNTVAIRLAPGAAIITNGAGAYGVIAQSIGGGGGVAGDPSAVTTYERAVPDTLQRRGSGNGGNVTVSATNARIETYGAYAPAVFAQTVGGGGGLFIRQNGGSPVLYRGSAGGSGTGGAITIDLVGTEVAATGAGSAGILAQSTGEATGAIKVTIDGQSFVRGGTPDPNLTNQDNLQRDAAAIRLLGGTGNTITNAGTIQGNNRSDNQPGIAILTDRATTVTNTGTIYGDQLYAVFSTVENLRGGTIAAPTRIDLAGGRLRNAGLLQVGGADVVGTTTINGDFVQTAEGVTVVDLGAASNVADRLVVTGSAALAGRIVPIADDAAKLRPGTREVTIVQASAGVTQTGPLTVSATPVVRFSVASPDTSTVNLRYTVDFGGTEALRAEGLASSNRGEVGRALNAILASESATFSPLARQLAGLDTSARVATALDFLSGEAMADLPQANLALQQAYTAAVSRHAREEGCGPEDVRTKPAADDRTRCALNPQGMRVWIGGFGGSEQLSGTDGRGSLHTQVAGGLIGLDKWFDPQRMLGVSIGGGTSQYSVPGRSSDGRSDSVNLSLYGQVRSGQAYFTGTVAYGHFGSEVRRTAIGDPTGLLSAGRGSTSSNAFGGLAEIGWTQPLGPVALTPFALLGVMQIWQDRLTETPLSGQNALATRYAATGQTSVPLTLGGRLSHLLPLDGEKSLKLSAELGWVHEFNPTRSARASFAGAPDVSFRVLGASASRDSAAAAFDAKLSLTRNLALLGRFSGRFSGVETAYGGFASLQATW